MRGSVGKYIRELASVLVKGECTDAILASRDAARHNAFLAGDFTKLINGTQPLPTPPRRVQARGETRAQKLFNIVKK